MYGINTVKEYVKKVLQNQTNGKPDLGNVAIATSNSHWNSSDFQLDSLTVQAGTSYVTIDGGSPVDYYDKGYRTVTNLSGADTVTIGGYGGTASIGRVYDDFEIVGSANVVSVDVSYVDEMYVGGSDNTLHITWSWADITVDGTANTVFAGYNSDVITVTGIGATIYGGVGDDDIIGGAGNDVLNGGDGTDDINGGAGNDDINGGTGNDFIHGADGDDILLGGDGNDHLGGGSGDDIIGGGSGDDYLHGDDGDDTMSDGAGTDHLSGGDGADTFLFIQDGSGDVADLGYDDFSDLVLVQGVGDQSGDLTIYNFDPGEDSVIGFTNSGVKIDLAALAMANGGDVEIGTDTFTFM